MQWRARFHSREQWIAAIIPPQAGEGVRGNGERRYCGCRPDSFTTRCAVNRCSARKRAKASGVSNTGSGPISMRRFRRNSGGGADACELDGELK